MPALHCKNGEGLRPQHQPTIGDLWSVYRDCNVHLMEWPSRRFSFYEWQKSVAPTQMNTGEADRIPIYVMYIHRITYLQENTVYKETESEKSNWNRNSWDETVTLTHLFIREDRNIECKSPHLSILQVHLCVVHSYRGKKTVWESESARSLQSPVQSPCMGVSLFGSLELRHIWDTFTLIYSTSQSLSFI